jgi:hypothetical protein
MQRIRFNSSESNKNNMAKRLLLIVILLLGFSSKAQDVMNEKKAQKDAVVATLNQKFSAKVLHAYQDNSKTKVADAFAYFQLLTDASLDADLKKEVVDNIHLLYQNPNALVIDFTSDSLDKIPLPQFIQKLLISEPILFAVSNEARYDGVSYQSWNTNYTVTRTKSGVTSTTNVMQTVYFYETPKLFGSETKFVFTTLLGAM